MKWQATWWRHWGRDSTFLLRFLETEMYQLADFFSEGGLEMAIHCDNGKGLCSHSWGLPRHRTLWVDRVKLGRWSLKGTTLYCDTGKRLHIYFSGFLVHRSLVPMQIGMIKGPEKESSNSYHDSRYWHRSQSIFFHLFLTFLAWMRSLEDSFDIPAYRWSSKEPTTLKSIFMYPKDKIPSQLIQSIFYKWFCPEINCNILYTGKSSRCLENRIKHNGHVTSAVYIHNISNNHP